jgi:heme exporter protein A
MAPVIDARQLSLELSNTPILTDVTFDLEPGAAVGLTGANGSGKSSLLRCLATLQRPSSGDLTILGADATSPERRKVRGAITLIGHDSGFYPELGLLENLLLVARLLGQDPQRAEDSLKAVGLGRAASVLFGTASKGMKRRAELARVLIQRPRLLLLDEAHAGLDAAAIDLVDQVVSRITSAGNSAVVVSHEPERLQGVVSRVLHLASGRIVP